jgi:hypothetical protein
LHTTVATISVIPTDAREVRARGAEESRNARLAKEKNHPLLLVLTKNVFTFAAEHIKIFVPMTYTAQ